MSSITALDGVRVVEIAHYIAGPQCCQVLADHGADVVKIEPRLGENSRRSGPVHEGDSLYFPAHNRGKRSIALDLTAEEGREALHRLLSEADVLVTNYSAGVPEKLGFGFDEVHAINPRTVVVHISGFGLTGPKSSWVAYDGMVQSMSGLADMTGEPDGPPVVPGPFVADNVVALQGVIAVLLGLSARERTGEGQLVDLGMLDSMMPILGQLVTAAAEGLPTTRFGSGLPTAFSGLHPTADGWVYLAPMTPKMWRAFSGLLGHPEWADEEEAETGWRMRHRAELDGVIAGWTSSRLTSEIVAVMQDAEVVSGPVRSVAQALDEDDCPERRLTHEVELASGRVLRVPAPAVRLGATPARPARSYPAVGEHDREVLTEAGYSAAEVDALVAAGIVGARPWVPAAASKSDANPAGR